MLFLFRRGQDKVSSDQAHDDESVGMTEGCDESEPDAQGGDEMIHPVGFAGTRILT